MPLSLSPRATWLSALSLLPPIAIFLATLLIGYRERRTLSLILVVFGVLSAFLGLAQVAEGPSSSLRFFAITNTSEAVGFFANRNHFAAALYAFTVFAAAWALRQPRRPHRGSEARHALDRARDREPHRPCHPGGGARRWRAPVPASASPIAALLGAVALAFRDRRNASGITPARLLFAATALATMFAAQFMLYRVLDRFAEDPMTDARVTLAGAHRGSRPALHAVRLGHGNLRSGLRHAGAGRGCGAGYLRQPRPQRFPRALAGDGRRGDGALCFLRALVDPAAPLRLWRGDAAAGTEIDLSMARAATLVVALILAHSLVDYPLRTGAIMAILAFACGLLVAPLAAPGAVAHREAARGRKRNVAPPRRRKRRHARRLRRARPMRLFRNTRPSVGATTLSGPRIGASTDTGVRWCTHGGGGLTGAVSTRAEAPPLPLRLGHMRHRLVLSIVDLCLIGLATLFAQLLRDSFETRPEQIQACCPISA